MEHMNSISDIKKFLGTPERPIDAKEFKAFWESLTEDEKMEYKQSELDA